ncbi:PLP-dependent aminotransferase family protein [Nocardioides lianchengensis]|uniref:GntR family transcriptional regulator / MocR family aminotransferase n=1 Tax=Nocardioides lianchengensis TaxID=1045774 RepID=A0A1G7BN44_9ACTN|nr:PLP-dependent aminotransferase family protein [Nocardioides lianchengensis]NYG08930.1 GntR family transcriptional regulator/MocR family aminotransferase [Nocardioides lianchengensis]SDE28514.1 GntR family transcriptional regulator / MocR family aminotransferase [Nocardioides lianchengensis]
MDLVVDLSSRADRATAIYRALLEAVRSGRLVPGDRLPPTRSLARDLGVSRTTVATAYERLVAEGFLEARVGDGTYVAAAAAGPRRRPARAALRARAGWGFEAHPVSGTAPDPPYDFRAGIPDASLFAFDTWRRLVGAELRAGAHAPGRYADPAGHPPLREAVVRHLALSRGVAADPEDVLVTHGTQQALDLVARVLLEPGDVVAVEDPGYPSARDLFASYGARVVPVPVDDDGLVVDLLPERARLVFTTPSHQFPLGPPLALDRRRALLDHAARHGTAIVEDDYDSEFRFTDRPLETLHALDEDGRVIYVGTFSKSLLPGLRAGYLVAPPSLRGALRGARQLADGYGALPEQAALARLVGDGLLARHVRRARVVYGERRDLMRTGVQELLGEHLEVVPCAAGLHLSARFRDPARSDVALAEAARAEGIALEALSSYAVEAPVRGLVLGYGAAATATITPGLERLARLL